MYNTLLAAIERKLGKGFTVIADYEHGSYQGEARILAVSKSGKRFADGEISWGSCSYCDPWYDMSEDEIDADMDRQVEKFTRKQFVAYLANIAKVDKPNASDYNGDIALARKALVWINDHL